MQKIVTKREKLIFFATIGVIVFAVLFNFLIVPVLNRGEILNKEISYNLAKLKKYHWLLAQSERIKNKSSKFSPSAQISSDVKDATIVILSELEEVARNSNVKIIDIRPQGSARGANLYKETLIDVRTEASAENYLKFIYNLQNSLSLLRIKRFQLTAKPNPQALEGNFSISQISLSD